MFKKLKIQAKNLKFLEIPRKLAEKNPETYEIDLAKMIIMGVVLFKKNKAGPQKAKEILQKYQHVSLVQNLIKIVESLE